jgi:hypothetical protein
MNARDADVLVHDHSGAEKLGPDPSLVQHRAVRGTGRDHRYSPVRLGYRASDPNGPGDHTLLRVRSDLPNSFPRRLVRPRDENTPCSTLQHRNDDLRDLVGGLPFGKHDLGGALPELAMQVDAGESEVPVRQSGELLDGRGRFYLALAHGLEQRFQLGSQTGHSRDSSPWVFDLPAPVGSRSSIRRGAHPRIRGCHQPKAGRMKRLGLLLVILGLAGGTLTTSAQTSTDATPRTICHRTSSATNPYVKLRVSGKQLSAHLKHAADIVPATGACPRTRLTATSGGRVFPVALTGEAESPAGDPVGTGTATVRLRAGQGQLCYQVAAKNLPAAAAMHIHKGASGVAGPVVVPLQTPNEAGTASGCVPAARTLVGAILANPASYYLNVHTAEFAAGAIRGQLTGTSTASFGWIVAVDLKGTSEPNATGTGVVRIRTDAGLVCYRLHAANVTLPTTAAHIHRGAAGVNGPVVVPFTAPGADGNSSGCVTASPATLISEITGNPAGFYINVHTNEHPAGAIRAQLG